MKALVIASLSYIGLGCTGFSEDADTVEPALAMTVTINGVEKAAEFGKPVEVPGKFENPTVKITAAKTRTFPYAGLKFNYPARFGWEAEKEPEVTIWTLEGNDFLMMIFFWGHP